MRRHAVQEPWAVVGADPVAELVVETPRSPRPGTGWAWNTPPTAPEPVVAAVAMRLATNSMITIKRQRRGA